MPNIWNYAVIIKILDNRLMLSIICITLLSIFLQSSVIICFKDSRICSDTCLSSADEMNPLPSLSKCLRPSIKSSTVSLIFFWETAWNEEIFEYNFQVRKLIRSVSCGPDSVAAGLFMYLTCKMGRKVSKETRPSVFWFCTRRRTSASVGFWPRARSTSPTWFACK